MFPHLKSGPSADAFTAPHQHEHSHRLRDAVSAAGDAYVEALVEIVHDHHAEPWEEALKRYDRRHPQEQSSAGEAPAGAVQGASEVAHGA